MLALEPWLVNREATELPRPYVKWSHEPARPEDVPGAIERAYHIAMAPPRGPVFVSIPMDDWDAPAEPHRATLGCVETERVQPMRRSAEAAHALAAAAQSGAHRRRRRRPAGGLGRGGAARGTAECSGLGSAGARAGIVPAGSPALPGFAAVGDEAPRRTVAGTRRGARRRRTDLPLLPAYSRDRSCRPRARASFHITDDSG